MWYALLFYTGEPDDCDLVSLPNLLDTKSKLPSLLHYKCSLHYKMFNVMQINHSND